MLHKTAHFKFTSASADTAESIKLKVTWEYSFLLHIININKPTDGYKHDL